MTLLDTGSIFLVARDLEFTWSPVFARWSSQVILEYILDVPELAVCLNRTQSSSSFIVVVSMSEGTVVGVFVQKLKPFMSVAEATSV